MRECIAALFAKIIEIETSIIIALKLNPFQFGQLTIMDFEFYFERVFKILQEQAKEAEESLKNSKYGGINNFKGAMGASRANTFSIM